MINHRQERKNKTNSAQGLLALAGGLLLGGLVGAVTTLLLAPQSGEKTRALIQQKSLELRDQTNEAVQAVAAQAGAKARQISGGVHEMAKDLEQRGQAIVDEQKQRWSPLVEAGKTAVQGA